MKHLNHLSQNISPDIIKRCKDKQLRKELYLFFALCSDHDRTLVMGKRKLRLKDFDRIHHLMLSLGLENLHTYFLTSHPDLLESLSLQIEKEIDTKTIDIKKEIAKTELWEKDFLDQLPSKKMKYFIHQILQA